MLYSTRFCALYGTAGPSAYVVPAGKRVVVRSISIVSTGSGTIQAAVSILGAGTIAAVTLSGVTFNMQHIDCRAVVNAGETIQMSGNAAFYGQVSGYLLDATAP